MAISSGSDDPIRNFSTKEEEILTRNLLKLTQAINNPIVLSFEYNSKFVCNLHYELFNGVRDHAGKCRNKDYGEEFLVFGPNRSVAAGDVPDRLQEHFDVTRKLFDQLDSFQKNIQFIQEVIKVSAYIHAELIRIHPFRDGNGRVSRLVMNYILRKYNLPLLPMNVPKQEYIDTLNHYYKTKDIEPLCELLIRVYYNQLLGN